MDKSCETCGNIKSHCATWAQQRAREEGYFCWRPKHPAKPSKPAEPEVMPVTEHRKRLAEIERQLVNVANGYGTVHEIIADLRKEAGE